MYLEETDLPEEMIAGKADYLKLLDSLFSPEVHKMPT